MTARRTILSRFRRHPRPTDPEPEYSRLDRLDGPPGRTRYDVEWPDVLAAEVGTVVGVSADEWSSLPPVFAPHSFVGGDLAAMAAPLPGMARDDLGTYAEPVEVGLTAEQIDAMRVGDPRPPRRYGVSMCIDGGGFLCTLPKGHPGRQHVAAGMRTVVAVWPSAPPHGRHRQTDPLDLILADLRDIEDRLS